MDSDKAKKKIQELAREGRITMADDTHVMELESETQLVLDAIAKAQSRPRLARAYVTDLSQVCDFGPWSPEQLSTLEKLLNIRGIEKKDAIWEVAQRLKAAN